MSTTTLFRIPIYRRPAALAWGSLFERLLTQLAAWGESATHHRLGSWTRH